MDNILKKKWHSLIPNNIIVRLFSSKFLSQFYEFDRGLPYNIYTNWRTRARWECRELGEHSIISEKTKQLAQYLVFPIGGAVCMLSAESQLF